MAYALGEGSSQRCYLCGSTYSQFNDIEKMIAKPTKKELLVISIPVLHCRIRIMESILRVSKKNGIEKILGKFKKFYIGNKKLCSVRLRFNRGLN